MKTFTKYTLVQAPSWVIVAVLLFGVRVWFEYPLWIAIALMAIYVVKDFVLYPFLRHSFESAPATAAAALIGERGVAQEDLGPRGYVRIRGELWQAEVARGAPPVGAGAGVVVRHARGMVLIVAAE